VLGRSLDNALWKLQENVLNFEFFAISPRNSGALAKQSIIHSSKDYMACSIPAILERVLTLRNG